MEQINQNMINQLDDLLFKDFNIYNLGVSPIWVSENILSDPFKDDHKLINDINQYLLDKISLKELAEKTKYHLPDDIKNKSFNILNYYILFEDMIVDNKLVMKKNDYIISFIDKIIQITNVNADYNDYFAYFFIDMMELGRPSISSFFKFYNELKKHEIPSEKLQNIFNSLNIVLNSFEYDVKKVS